MAVGNESNHRIDGLTVEGGLDVDVITAGEMSMATSAGDSQYIYYNTTGKIDLRNGLDSAPDTGYRPTLKVSRKETVTRAALEAATATGADGAELLAAIYGVCVGQEPTEVQAVGVMGAAYNDSTAAIAGNDACGIYGLAQVAGTGADGTAIGAFLAGRRDVNTARTCALELHSYNGTATAGSYSSTGFQSTQGLWINAGGSAQSAAAIAVSNAFGRQYDVGLAFTAQVAGGFTGGIATTSIRDDSTSTTSIAIKGTHTNAITVDAAAGPVRLGNAATAGSGSILEIVGPTGVVNNVIAFNAPTATDGLSLRLGNGGGSMQMFVAGGVNNFMTGVAQSDTGITVNTSGKFFHIGGATSVIKVGRADTLGFFNATAIAKPTVTGSRGANAALASLCTQLAALGLITDSTS